MRVPITTSILMSTETSDSVLELWSREVCVAFACVRLRVVVFIDYFDFLCGIMAKMKSERDMDTKLYSFSTVRGFFVEISI